MSIDFDFQLCPETGIGCLMVQDGQESMKLDLMPDEAADLQNLVQIGDLDSAKELLVSVDSRIEAVLDGPGLEVLSRQLR